MSEILYNKTHVDILKKKNDISLRKTNFNSQISLKIEDVFDFSLDEKTRIEIIHEIDEENSEVMFEIIKKFAGMYQFSGVVSVKKILVEICTKSNLNIFLKIECIKSVLFFSKNKDNEIYEILSNILRTVYEPEKDLPTPCKLEAIYILMESENQKHMVQASKLFCEIITNSVLTEEFRYKTLCSLSRQPDIKNTLYQTKKAYFKFAYSDKAGVYYRCMTCQYLLGNLKNDLKCTKIEKIENIILGFAEDINVDYNRRADAADMLIGLTLDKKQKGIEILKELSSVNGPVKTIFDNAQNVHTRAVESSVVETIEFLMSNKEKCEIKFDLICKKIKSKNKNIKIKNALKRIRHDEMLYSIFSMRLLFILEKIWQYISSHKNKKDLKKRLVEELEDMSDTCSSGYATRLVNVLSGYIDKISTKQSWEDQIIANFVGRLNAKMRNIGEEYSKKEYTIINRIVQLYVDKQQNSIKTSEKTDKLYYDFLVKCIKNYPQLTVENCITYEKRVHIHAFESLINTSIEKYIEKKQNKPKKEDSVYCKFINKCIDSFKRNAVNEISIQSKFPTKRKHFLLFFNMVMSQIREEMYLEFSSYISDTDFDVYIKSAILIYDSG